MKKEGEKDGLLDKSEKSPVKSPERKRFEEIEKRVNLVLELIRQDSTISRAYVSQALGITDSQARTAINKLKERGMIHRDGSDKNGSWIVD